MLVALCSNKLLSDTLPTRIHEITCCSVAVSLYMRFLVLVVSEGESPSIILVADSAAKAAWKSLQKVESSLTKR